MDYLQKGCRKLEQSYGVFHRQQNCIGGFPWFWHWVKKKLKRTSKDGREWPFVLLIVCPIKSVLGETTDFLHLECL